MAICPCKLLINNGSPAAVIPPKVQILAEEGFRPRFFRSDDRQPLIHSNEFPAHADSVQPDIKEEFCIEDRPDVPEKSDLIRLLSHMLSPQGAKLFNAPPDEPDTTQIF